MYGNLLPHHTLLATHIDFQLSGNRFFLIIHRKQTDIGLIVVVLSGKVPHLNLLDKLQIIAVFGIQLINQMMMLHMRRRIPENRHWIQ